MVMDWGAIGVAGVAAAGGGADFTGGVAGGAAEGALFAASSGTVFGTLGAGVLGVEATATAADCDVKEERLEEAWLSSSLVPSASLLSVTLALLLVAGRVVLLRRAGEAVSLALAAPAFFGVLTASICVCRTNMPWLSGHLKYDTPCTVPLFLPVWRCA
jgi:hypothetical protein